MMSHRTTFSLDAGTVASIRRLALQWGVSQAEVIRRLVAQGVAPAMVDATNARPPEQVHESLRAWPALDDASVSQPGPSRADRLRRLLEREIWPTVPAASLGAPLSKAEKEVILGYDSDGV